MAVGPMKKNETSFTVIFKKRLFLKPQIIKNTLLLGTKPLYSAFQSYSVPNLENNICFCFFLLVLLFSTELEKYFLHSTYILWHVIGLKITKNFKLGI